MLERETPSAAAADGNAPSERAAKKRQKTKARGNGEGSIYQRGSDGRWCAAVSQGGRRRILYGATREEVRDKLADVLGQKARGVIVTGPRQPLKVFMERWLTETAKRRVRPSTYAGYHGAVHNHIIPALGHISVADLAPEQVQAFFNRLQDEEGLKGKSVAKIRGILRNALKQAEMWDLVTRNVAKLTDAPTIEPFESPWLDPDKARRFLEATRGDRLEALWAVGLALGLRIGEALGARWPDVDLERGEWHVTHALQRVGYPGGRSKLELVELKTVKSRRTLSIPEPILPIVREHRARQIEERLQKGMEWDRGGYVFTTAIGTPLEATNVTRRLLQRVLERAGLPHMRFHDLRHSCGSLLVAQDVHPKVVMEILGHSQISLTMNLYAKVADQLKREAAAGMGHMLFASAPRGV